MGKILPKEFSISKFNEFFNFSQKICSPQDIYACAVLYISASYMNFGNLYALLNVLNNIRQKAQMAVKIAFVIRWNFIRSTYKMKARNTLKVCILNVVG